MLNIPARWEKDWQRFIGSLEEENVWINDNQDALIWALDPHGRYSPKVGYASSMVARQIGDISWWWRHLWKLKVPPKTKLSMRCILMDKAPTELKLMCRAINGPSRCSLCKQQEEDTNNLFLTCPVSNLFWSRITTSLNLHIVWLGKNI